jgi:ribosome-associated protein
MEKHISTIKNLIEDRLRLLDNEIQIDCVRSSRAGGQNVNKLSTKVKLRWGVDNSNIFSFEEKKLIKMYLKNRLTKEGDIIFESQEERSQFQNKEKVIERFKKFVGDALIPEKERVPTKPTRSRASSLCSPDWTSKALS